MRDYETNLPNNLGNAKYDIAIGKHRNTKVWANKSMTAQEISDMCRNPHRVSCTVKEYHAATKQRRGEIKDSNGAFVGGYLVNGRRTRDSVLCRPLLTLDADNLNGALQEFIESYITILNLKGFLYTTCSHTPEKPRIRLVIFPDRDLTPDEYEPVCRYITNLLGIEQFDRTTYDINRLMYLPVVPKDGEFFFVSFDGAPLVVDAMKRQYRNWKDSSEWPMAEAETRKVLNDIKKAGDPTEKPGIVGLFCRAHGVIETIEKFLPDAYEPTTDPNRRTYSPGSAEAGLIIYDNKHAYSHHGTDPISGKLCNSFDLARIHLFGHLDENAKPDTPVNRLPSHTAMVEFAMNDPEVRRLNWAERDQDLKDDYGDVDTDPEELDWAGELGMSKRGETYSTHDNAKIILRNDPRLAGRFQLNELTGQIDVSHPMPWSSGKSGIRPMEDDDERGLRAYLGSNLYLFSSSRIINDVYPLIAKENAYHPIKDYLERLEWDGEDRVTTLLTDYLGAEDTPLNRAFIRKWLCAAVARVHKPGTKFDYVLTLIGPEGTRKSTFFKSLAPGWFSDTFTFSMLSGGNGVRAYEQIIGKWIVEIAEMAGLRKAEIEAAKSFLSATEDSFRGSYGKHTSTFQRQVVFGGTTNNIAFLIGQTGNRRFWPVRVAVSKPVKEIHGETIERAEIEQIWGQVMTMWQDEPLYLSAELETQARALQTAHTEEDDWTREIEEYLDVMIPTDWYRNTTRNKANYIRTKMSLPTNGYFPGVTIVDDESEPETDLMLRRRVCVSEIWYELLDTRDTKLSKMDGARIRSIMRTLRGWHEPVGKMKHLGGATRVFDRREEVAVVGLVHGNRKP